MESRDLGGRPHGGATHDGFNGIVSASIEIDHLPIVKQLALANKRIEQLLERTVRQRHIKDGLGETLIILVLVPRPSESCQAAGRASTAW
jgi:hypothetical protein